MSELVLSFDGSSNKVGGICQCQVQLRAPLTLPDPANAGDTLSNTVSRGRGRPFSSCFQLDHEKSGMQSYVERYVSDAAITLESTQRVTAGYWRPWVLCSAGRHGYGTAAMQDVCVDFPHAASSFAVLTPSLASSCALIMLCALRAAAAAASLSRSLVTPVKL